jgi:hypothetical protein
MYSITIIIIITAIVVKAIIAVTISKEDHIISQTEYFFAKDPLFNYRKK